MASMNMSKAFNAKMLTKMIRYRVMDGSYDDDNNWIEGRNIQSNLWGVVKVGNQFSQFDEGEALHSEDGGQRFSNFITVYVTGRFELGKTDKVKFKGKYFNLLQRSDETQYNFRAYLMEETEEWQP